MADNFDLEISVISQKGVCSAGHKAGDNWVMGDVVFEINRLRKPGQ
jgi:hypothetical protein